MRIMMVQLPQPTNSGGLIAALELLGKDDDFLNDVVKNVIIMIRMTAIFISEQG